MLHMPTSMLMGGGGAKDYAAWLAHIATRTSSTGFWRSNMPVGAGQAYRAVNDGEALTGSLRGSPWNWRGFNAVNANTGRLVQHSLPSFDVFEAVRLAGTEVFLQTADNFEELPLLAVNRNGFTSSSGAITGDLSVDIVEASYWNPVTGFPETMNPSEESGPIPYSHAGW